MDLHAQSGKSSSAIPTYQEYLMNRRSYLRQLIKTATAIALTGAGVLSCKPNRNRQPEMVGVSPRIVEPPEIDSMENRKKPVDTASSAKNEDSLRSKNIVKGRAPAPRPASNKPCTTKGGHQSTNALDSLIGDLKSPAIGDTAKEKQLLDSFDRRNSPSTRGVIRPVKQIKR
jgi:hypothetical protein